MIVGEGRGLVVEGVAQARAPAAGATTCSAAAMCMAVGKVSLEDWPRLTSSLGWTGFLLPSTPPAQLDGAVG
jgi:hypothetical protein